MDKYGRWQADWCPILHTDDAYQLISQLDNLNPTEAEICVVEQ